MSELPNAAPEKWSTSMSINGQKRTSAVHKLRSALGQTDMFGARAEFATGQKRTHAPHRAQCPPRPIRSWRFSHMLNPKVQADRFACVWTTCLPDRGGRLDLLEALRVQLRDGKRLFLLSPAETKEIAVDQLV
jgi:hypothetical protein